MLHLWTDHVGNHKLPPTYHDVTCCSTRALASWAQGPCANGQNPNSAKSWGKGVVLAPLCAAFVLNSKAFYPQMPKTSMHTLEMHQTHEETVLGPIYNTKHTERKRMLRQLSDRPSVTNTGATSVRSSKQHTLPYNISTINKYRSHAIRLGSQANKHNNNRQSTQVLQPPNLRKFHPEIPLRGHTRERKCDKKLPGRSNRRQASPSRVKSLVKQACCHTHASRQPLLPLAQATIPSQEVPLCGKEFSTNDLGSELLPHRKIGLAWHQVTHMIASANCLAHNLISNNRWNIGFITKRLHRRASLQATSSTRSSALNCPIYLGHSSPHSPNAMSPLVGETCRNIRL